MGNYEEHVQYGHVAYVLLCIAVTGALLSGGVQLLEGALLLAGMYPFVRLGAAFPDVDHHASHPHRMLKKVMFVTGIVGTYLLVLTFGFEPLLGVVTEFVPVERASAVTSVGILVLALLGGVVTQGAVTRFRPKHRGITHRIPTGLVVSVVIAGVLGGTGTYFGVQYAVTVSAVFAGAFFIGFLSHLQCDGMLLPAFQNTVRRVFTTIRSLRHAVFSR
jgi:phage shock protein PspC (stress-responsive transcriptional regulator)